MDVSLEYSGIVPKTIKPITWYFTSMFLLRDRYEVENSICTLS